MSSELGTLVVVVLKARNLNDKHFYKQDVFAQISIPTTASPTPLVKRTQVDVKGGQHPLWDEEIRMSISKDPGAANKNRILEVSCWAKDHRNDDLLGTGTLDISDTLRTGEFDDWIKLEIDGVSRGELYLEMTFYANAPAPLTRRPTKMNPKERLWRAPVAGTSPRGNHLLALPEGGSPPTQNKIPASLASGSSRPAPNANANSARPAGGSPPLNSARIPASLAAGSSRPIPNANSSRPAFPEGGSSAPLSKAQFLASLSAGSPSRAARPIDNAPRPAGGSPPLNNARIPASLAAGARPRAASNANAARPTPDSNSNQTLAPAPALAAFPSILRSGPRKTAPTPAPAPASPPLAHAQPSYISAQPSYASAQPSYPSAHTQSTYPSTHTQSTYPSAHTQSTYPSAQPQPQPSYPAPPQQTRSSVPALRFPEATTGYGYGYGYNTYTEPNTEPNTEPALPDPYLLARYHSPLPLPPGGAPPALPARKLQQSPPPPRRDPAKEAAEIAQREAEAERRRRAEQEDADAELARRLDAELNAEEDAGGARG